MSDPTRSGAHEDEAAAAIILTETYEDLEGALDQISAAAEVGGALGGLEDPQRPRGLPRPWPPFSDLLRSLAKGVEATSRAGEPPPAAVLDLIPLCKRVLEGLEELDLVRDESSTGYAVLTAQGQALPLDAAVEPAGAAALEVLRQALLRARAVGVCLREGVTSQELASLLAVLAGRSNEAMPFDGGALVVTERDLPPRPKRFSGPAELCLGRLAKDPTLARLAADPRRPGPPPRLRNPAPGKMLAHVVQAREVLSAVDILLASAMQRSAPTPEALVLAVQAVAQALPASLALELSRVQLRELRASGRGSGLGVPLRVQLAGLARRWLRERSAASDALLAELVAAEVLTELELPPELQLARSFERELESTLQAAEGARRAAEEEAQRVARELATLEGRMAPLVQSAAAEQLWPLVRRLRMLQGAEGEEPSVHAAQAQKILQAVLERPKLGPLATLLFNGQPPAQEAASSILVAAGPAGVHASCAERIKARLGPDARNRFVRTVRGVGPAGLPILAALLFKVDADSRGERGALAEDLLRALPEAPDEALGEHVSRFVRNPLPSVRRAAVTALTGLWGPRARRALAECFSDADEGVRVAAVAGLRKLGSVDRTQLGVLLAWLDGTRAAGTELKVESALALGAVQSYARDDGLAALQKALAAREQRSALAGLLLGGAKTEEAPEVGEALARALLSLQGDAAKPTLQRFVTRAAPEVGKRVQKLLTPA